MQIVWLEMIWLVQILWYPSSVELIFVLSLHSETLLKHCKHTNHSGLSHKGRFGVLIDPPIDMQQTSKKSCKIICNNDPNFCFFFVCLYFTL